MSIELRAVWWGRSGPGALLPEQNWAFRALLMDPEDWVRLWKLGNQEPNQGVNWVLGKVFGLGISPAASCACTVGFRHGSP